MTVQCAVNEKSKSKKYYDLKVRVVEFEDGDLVLMLLPLIGKPLQARYGSPYKIFQSLNGMDYVISTPDRRKKKRVLQKFINREEVPIELSVDLF